MIRLTGRLSCARLTSSSMPSNSVLRVKCEGESMLTSSINPARWNLEEGTRVVTIGVCGAMLGISWDSARGLVVGAIIGVITGYSRNQELRQEKRGGRDR